MSQMENLSDFNHFTLEEFQNFHAQDEELAYHSFEPMDIDSYPEEESMSQQAEEYKDQILYNHGNGDYHHTQENNMYDNWQRSEQFDQYLDTDTPMPDAPPLNERRPKRRTGFTSENQGQPQPRPAAPLQSQRPTITQGFQPRLAPRGIPPVPRPTAPNPQPRPRPRPQGEQDFRPQRPNPTQNPAPTRDPPPNRTDMPPIQRRYTTQSKDILSQITGCLPKLLSENCCV